MPLQFPPLFPHPGIRSVPTTYYTPATIQASTASAAVQANQIYYLPFNLPGEMIDRVAIETTGGIGGTARVGIYTNLKGLPDQLILDAGDFDTSSVAVAEATIAALTFPLGFVWAAAVFTGTPTMRQGAAAGSHILGVSSTGAAVARGIIVPFTYGALPQSAPLVSASIAISAPCIFVRKS